MRAAFSYFSIFPVGWAGAPQPRTFVYVPLVGAVIGALAGSVAWAVSLRGPHALAVATAFGLSVVLTGALHIDGFLDVCDAAFAAVTPERRLEILKDPRHGSFALAGFAVLCAFWIAALWCIDPLRLPLALAFAACAGRWLTVCVATVIPYGPGAEQPPRLVHAAMGVLALALGWSYWGHAVTLIVLGGATFGVAFFLKRCFGGRLPGDGYGFLIVCTEVGILCGLPFTSP